MSGKKNRSQIQEPSSAKDNSSDLALSGDAPSESNTFQKDYTTAAVGDTSPDKDDPTSISDTLTEQNVSPQDEPSSISEDTLSEKNFLTQDDPTSVAEKRVEKPNPGKKESKSSSPEPSEKAAGGGCVESSDPLPESESQGSQSDSPLEGAVGGEISQNRRKSSLIAANIRELNKQFSVRDKKKLCEGKLDVFQRFFNEEGMRFPRGSDLTAPQPTVRQRDISEGCSSDASPNSLQGAQESDNSLTPLYNQAGARVGTQTNRRRSSMQAEIINPLSGFGFVSETEHSLGSAETTPIHEVYSDVFAQSGPSSVASSKGSCGTFPSFHSNTSTSSSESNPAVSPMPGRDSPDGVKEYSESLDSARGRSIHLSGARGRSPGSTDSESVPREKAVRRKRSTPKKRVIGKTREASDLTGSEGSGSDGLRGEQRSMALRKLSKDSSGDSSETTSSLSNVILKATDGEAEVKVNPEFAHSVESDNSSAAPSTRQNVAERLKQNLQAISVSDEKWGKSNCGDTQKVTEFPDENQETEDSTEVSSDTPDVSKEKEQPLPKGDF